MKPSQLLQAEPIAVKQLQTRLFKIVKNHKPYLVTTEGKRQMFLIPYEDLVDLVEIMEESKDAVLREEINRARKEYREGGGVPFED